LLLESSHTISEFVSHAWTRVSDAEFGSTFLLLLYLLLRN
jgi:hypothetical protein